MPGDAQHQLTDSERQWLAVRDYLREHRHELAVSAAEQYPSAIRVAGTPLLTVPSWVPERPIPLSEIGLELRPDDGLADIGGTDDAAPGVLPVRADGAGYGSYADALGALAAPAVFENRSTYRFVDADLAGASPRLLFARGRYFDSINTGEALAHEYASSRLGHPVKRGLRAVIGDPCDPARRPTNLAISTITIRNERKQGSATFFLQWRDPAKVGHAGGLYQVVPVGIFQPSGEAEWNERNDFSLWRNTIRELAEELLGEDEDYDSEQAPIDYARWPFAARLSDALAAGGVRAWCLGLGVDPLTFATDLLTAVVIDAPLFDELFGQITPDNAEGRVLEAQPFTAESIEELTSQYPFQAAGAALLRLAQNDNLI